MALPLIRSFLHFYLIMNRQDDRNQDSTIYVGNVDERVSEAILWELFLQAGPVGILYYEIFFTLFVK